MARARRKMRRKLIKQMKKGHLSAAERRELLDLDREVNRANRQGAAIGAAGLGTALAIANKAGAGDALGEFLDKRQEKKKKKAEFQAESQKIGDKVSDQVQKDAKKELMDSLPGDKSDVRRSIDDISIPKMQGIEEEEEKFEDKELDDTLRQYELQKAMEANPALAATLGQGEAPIPPSSIRPVGPGPKYDEGEGRTFDEIMDARRADPPEENERLDRRLERRGGFDPRTGEYVDSAKQRAADEEFDREFDESLPDAELMEIARLNNEGRREEAERLASQVLTPGVGRSRSSGEMVTRPDADARMAPGRVVDPLRGDLPSGSSDYGGGFDTSGERPEFSSSSLRRSDGPRVDNAKGGYTPFLRSMRDRIRRRLR